MIEKMKKSEVKEFMKVMEKLGIQHFDYGLFKEYKKVYITTKEFDNKAVIELNSQKAGLLIGWYDGEGFIFTIEGAQILCKNYKKVFELDEKQIYYWMHGQNFDVKLGDDYYLLKHHEDIVGWGKVRNGILLNNVNKERVVFRL